MARKIRVGIIFGGKSAEHEISFRSAKNVIDALDKKRYEPVLIGIDKRGKWFLNDPAILRQKNIRALSVGRKETGVAFLPDSDGELKNLETSQNEPPVHVVFPILHGPLGEDGTVQGLLKLANVPFVGASVLGSAIGMDKDVMKRLLRDADLPIPRFLVLYEDEPVSYQKIVKVLGSPFFVKPANLGSSVGVSKVKSKKEYYQALEEAFLFDRKIMAEEYIPGREIECAVLGNDQPKASQVGEIIPHHEFYSYEAKYLDENGASIEIPAKIPQKKVREIQKLAIKAFQTLCCEGMGRVDFFLRKDGRIFINEINTIPGFTSISMYPKLWEASGISYSALIDKLLKLAIERFEKEQRLLTSYTSYK